MPAMETTEKLNSIDQSLSKQIKKLLSVISKLEFQEVCQFNLGEGIGKVPLGELKYPGVYLVEIKNDNKFDTFNSWVENFRHGWENEAYYKKFVPNLKKKRVIHHKELNEWVPIYLGKSKDIGSRLKCHIYQELYQKTFALKLLARQNLKEDTFKFSTIRLEVNNYDWIVPIIERNLRDKLNPIIGRQ
jgi:hypothetical protein